MNRMIKTGGLLVVVLSIVIAIGSLDTRETYAGGGINYKVTVSNPTDKTCSAWVMVEKGYAQTSKETVTISPGGSYTWETGALCPCGLKGNVYDPVGKEWRRMQCTNMYGNRSDCSTGLGNMAVCGSQSFTIERKEGVTEVREFDYGFKKN